MGRTPGRTGTKGLGTGTTGTGIGAAGRGPSGSPFSPAGEAAAVVHLAEEAVLLASLALPGVQGGGSSLCVSPPAVDKESTCRCSRACGSGRGWSTRHLRAWWEARRGSCTAVPVRHCHPSPPWSGPHPTLGPGVISRSRDSPCWGQQHKRQSCEEPGLWPASPYHWAAATHPRDAKECKGAAARWSGQSSATTSFEDVRGVLLGCGLCNRNGVRQNRVAAARTGPAAAGSCCMATPTQEEQEGVWYVQIPRAALLQQRRGHCRRSRRRWHQCCRCACSCRRGCGAAS